MREILLHVREFKSDNELLDEKQGMEPVFYNDGTVELRAEVVGTDHAVYIRFPLAEVVRLAAVKGEREEAPN